jgi:hypothetical protein
MAGLLATRAVRIRPVVSKGYDVGNKDKTIYLACVGWILLDAAFVIGVIVHA